MRLRLVALLPLLVFISMLGANTPAQAEPGDDVLDVTGTLVDTRSDPPKPVPDVTISVEIDGQEVASGTSDAEGRYSVPLPGTPDELVGEKIIVKLDTTTLPAGHDPHRREEHPAHGHDQDQLRHPDRLPDRTGRSTRAARSSARPRKAPSTASFSASCSPLLRSASRSSSAPRA